MNFKDEALDKAIALANKLTVERDQLTDEVHALRDALRDCAGGLRYIRETHGELYGVGFDRALAKADALLNMR